MEAISLPLDDFDLVIHSLQSPRMDRIIAVIEDTISVATQGLGELRHLRIVHSLSQSTPFIDGFISPCPGSINPDMFEFVFQDQDRIDEFVQLEQFFQMLPIFRPPDISPVFQQEILGALKNLFVGLGSFPVFAVAHFIDHPVELSHHMEQIEDDLDMRDFCLHGHDIGIPHIHHHSFQLVPLLPAHAREKSLQGLGFAVFAHPNHTPGLVVQDYGQVAVAFVDGHFVDGQDAKSLIVGLPILFLQALQIDGLDRFPVQSQMADHLLDGHNLAEFEDITRQPLGHPQVGIVEVELLDRSLLAILADDLPVQTANPDPRRTEVQVSDPPSLLAVNLTPRPATEMTDGVESLVGNCLQVSFPGIGEYPLSENTDSREGEIMCYIKNGHRWPALDGDLETYYLYHP